MTLADMPTTALLRLLAYQVNPAATGAVATWDIGPCGHIARGADWCEGCLRTEIERREAASA